MLQKAPEMNLAVTRPDKDPATPFTGEKQTKNERGLVQKQEKPG